MVIECRANRAPRSDIISTLGLCCRINFLLWNELTRDFMLLPTFFIIFFFFFLAASIFPPLPHLFGVRF